MDSGHMLNSSNQLSTVVSCVNRRSNWRIPAEEKEKEKEKELGKKR